ncbi:hypothetical protein IV102_27430 [bacterium]|nr:hypothetical protein [bacterium]
MYGHIAIRGLEVLVKEAGAALLLSSAHLAPTNAAALQTLDAVGNPAEETTMPTRK